jgi:hypothetical protein
MFPLLKDAEFDDLSRTSESIASLPCELHSQLTLKHGETLNESGVAVLAHDPCSVSSVASLVGAPSCRGLGEDSSMGCTLGGHREGCAANWDIWVLRSRQFA